MLDLENPVKVPSQSCGCYLPHLGRIRYVRLPNHNDGHDGAEQSGWDDVDWLSSMTRDQQYACELERCIPDKCRGLIMRYDLQCWIVLPAPRLWREGPFLTDFVFSS